MVSTLNCLDCFSFDDRSPVFWFTSALLISFKIRRKPSPGQCFRKIALIVPAWFNFSRSKVRWLGGGCLICFVACCWETTFLPPFSRVGLPLCSILYIGQITINFRVWVSLKFLWFWLAIGILLSYDCSFVAFWSHDLYCGHCSSSYVLIMCFEISSSRALLFFISILFMIGLPSIKHPGKKSSFNGWFPKLPGLFRFWPWVTSILVYVNQLMSFGKLESGAQPRKNCPSELVWFKSA